MTKETPERFAKNILWMLADLKAATDQLRDEICWKKEAELRIPAKLIAKKLAADHKKLRKKIFDDLLKGSHLE